jgi:hypothetical protein
VEYYNVYFRGKGLPEKGTEAGEFARFAKRRQITQEFFLREVGQEKGMFQGTDLEKHIQDVWQRVEEQTIDARAEYLKAERKLAKKKRDPKPSEELQREISALEATIEKYETAQSSAFHGEMLRTMPRLHEIVLSGSADKIDMLYQYVADAVHRGIGHKGILNDISEYFLTGGPEIKGRLTRVSAALFVAGDDAPRYAYARSLWSDAVKKHGTFELPEAVELEITRKARGILPDYGRSSALMRASRLENMWNFFPWKMTGIAMKFVAKNPEAAAFWIFMAKQLEDYDDQSVSQSWAELMTGRDGYGSVMSTQWGGMKSDFFKFTPEISSVMDMLKNNPVSDLVKIVKPIVDAISSDNISFREGMLKSMQVYTDVTAGGAQIPAEVALMHFADTMVHEKDLGEALKSTVADGGRHVDMWRAYATNKRNKHGKDVGLKDALLASLTGIEMVKPDVVDRMGDIKDFERVSGDTDAARSRYLKEASRQIRKRANREEITPTESARLDRLESEAVNAAFHEDEVGKLAAWYKSRGLHKSEHYERFKRKIERRILAIKENPEVSRALKDAGIVIPTMEDLFPEADSVTAEPEQLPLIDEGWREEFQQ